MSACNTLSCPVLLRQQLQGALTVVDAGLDKLQPQDCCDHGLTASTSSSSGSSSMGSIPNFYDILLLRVEAQLLLALSDASRAVSVLGSALRRLTNARKGMAVQPGGGSVVAAELLREQEAQVGGSCQPQVACCCKMHVSYCHTFLGAAAVYYGVIHLWSIACLRVTNK